MKIENFRIRYLRKLLDIKAQLDKIVVLPTKYARKKSKKQLDILPDIYEYEEYDELEPSSLMRQSSYQDEPYEEFGILKKYKHKINPKKQRHYFSEGRYFDIEDE
jgi:hypothetical protein